MGFAGLRVKALQGLGLVVLASRASLFLEFRVAFSGFCVLGFVFSWFRVWGLQGRLEDAFFQFLLPIITL